MAWLITGLQSARYDVGVFADEQSILISCCMPETTQRIALCVGGLNRKQCHYTYNLLKIIYFVSLELLTCNMLDILHVRK